MASNNDVPLLCTHLPTAPVTPVGITAVSHGHNSHADMET